MKQIWLKITPQIIAILSSEDGELLQIDITGEHLKDFYCNKTINKELFMGYCLSDYWQDKITNEYKKIKEKERNQFSLEESFQIDMGSRIDSSVSYFDYSNLDGNFIYFWIAILVLIIFLLLKESKREF